MATLTETAYYTRKSLKWGAIALGVYIILKIVISISIQIYKQMNPTPPPPPTRGFGLLNPIDFPVSEIDTQLKYSLQTPNLKLPIMPTQVAVYATYPQKANLSASDQAQKIAKQLGFFGKYQALSAKDYRWKLNIPAPMTLELDIVSQDFSINYQWQEDHNILTSTLPPKQDTVDKIIKNLFSNLQTPPTDIDSTNLNVKYLRASGNKLVKAPSLSEAHFVQVDLERNKLNEIPFVTDNPEKGIIHMVLSGSSNQLKQFIQLDYRYYPINYTSKETYYSLDIQKAWQAVNAGNAFIAQADSQAEEINIRRIYLAYYDKPYGQPFIQPIYVFSGDDQNNNPFVAYYDAIDPSQIKSSANN